MLAWHGFSDQPNAPGENLTESFAGFEAMVRFLRENDFRSVFPEQVRGGRAGRGRAVILTFDDGRKEQVRAAEILERYGFRGIFFVIPNRTRDDAQGFLTPEDVRRLARAGHRVAAHGYDHRSMATSGTEVAASVVRSPAMLGRSAGTRPANVDFAFPFGHYTAEVVEAVSPVYRYLHTVNPGYWDGRSALLPRMLVMSDVEPSLFRDYVLAGGRYGPRMELLTPDGGVAREVAFRVRGGALPAEVLLFAISSDAQGRSYNLHPLGENLRMRGDTAWVDLAAHMGRYFPPGRMVVSYALVTREGGGLRYLSPGVQHWLREAATWGRPAPQPVPAAPSAAEMPAVTGGKGFYPSPRKRRATRM